MDKDTILDYVTETPGNTNRAVLGSMLDSIGGNGGSIEPLICRYDNEAVHLDTTFGDIKSAVLSGRQVLLRCNDYGDSYELGIFMDYYITGSEKLGYSARVDFFGGALSTSTVDTLNALDDEYPYWSE